MKNEVSTATSKVVMALGLLFGGIATFALFGQGPTRTNLSEAKVASNPGARLVIVLANGIFPTVATIDPAFAVLDTSGPVPVLRGVGGGTTGPIFQQQFVSITTAGQIITLSATPVAGPRPIEVYKNGLKMQALVDYNIVNLALTFTAGPAGQTISPGDSVEIGFYR